ncbi:MAG: calcium-binding protein, partial [Pseudomonadota bacterium]
GNRARVRGFENVDGGDGDDLIVGSSVRNILDGGLGNDRVLGAGGDDFIDGNEGDDVLFGNTDDDLIIGGLGDDVLYGGGGIDRFLFLEGDGNDIIRDFQDNADKIWIRGGYSFADLTIEDTGPHVQVSFELNDITIHNIDLNRITAADFIFA